MMNTQRMYPGETEQFRQQIVAMIDHIWETEWSRWSDGDGLRWFRHAWRDTQRILERTRPGADEQLERYVLRIRSQLKAIEWQYLFGFQDHDGYVDESDCYARGIRAVVQTLTHIGLGLLELECQA